MPARKWIPGFIALFVIALGGGYWFLRGQGSAPTPVASDAPAAAPSIVPVAMVSPMPIADGSPRPLDLATDENGMSHSTIVIQTDKGVIKFKLYSNDAPKTVARIAELVQKGFYDGLIFHRVEPGFVVQTGDPQGTGKGGSGQKLDAEFNSRRHLEGTVAMARTHDPNSADSQFYITLSPQPDLDHQYTVFGQVIEGMDVVRKIAVGDKMIKVTID